MTSLRRFRPVLIVGGGLLLVGSLLGARLLAHASAPGDTGASPQAPAKAGSGPVVIGYVDTDPPPVSFLLPPVLPSGEVVEVFVTAGQDVEAGAKLYKFDTQVMEADLVTAERAVDTAKTKVRQAELLKQQHADRIELQEDKIKAAELKVFFAQKHYHVFEANMRARLKGNFKPEEVDKQVAESAELFGLETTYRTADRELVHDRKTLEILKRTDAGAAVAEADAEVKRYESLVKKARVAIDLCTVRTKLAGTIERVNVSPGDVLGMATRTPAVVLIPKGPRVVRAEVEADFAHRVTNDMLGKTVSIVDNTDPKITYKGTVKRIGGSFLPKRSGDGGGFVPNETRALEAVVEVTDPSPPGQPPLRVGQKVRVNFGQ